MAHAFNHSTWEAEAGISLSVRGQLGLQELVPGQAPKLQRNPVLKNQKKKKKIHPDVSVALEPFLIPKSVLVRGQNL